MMEEKELTYKNIMKEGYRINNIKEGRRVQNMNSDMKTERETLGSYYTKSFYRFGSFLFSFIFLLFFSFASSLILFSCAKKIPEAELKAAKEAIEKARSLGADKTDEFKLAQKYYDEAQKHVEEKKYDDARTKAIISKEFAELAIEKWEKMKREMEKKKEEEEGEGKVKIVEEEPEFYRPKLPFPSEIKGINPDDIEGTSTLGRGYVLKQFKKVYFEFDSYSLTDEAKRAIEHNAEIAKKILAENPNITLLIEGHCDERGSNEYNLELGWKRAQSIKRYLVLLGIPEDRIQTVSFGEEFPEAPCPPPQCRDEEKWRKNRRGVFVITVRE